MSRRRQTSRSSYSGLHAEFLINICGQQLLEIEIQISIFLIIFYLKVPPGECSALWPRSDHEHKTLKANVAGYSQKTAAFIYTDVHTTLLKLDNKVVNCYFKL